MLYDVIQVWMAARHDNGDKVLHTLVHHHFAFEEKQFALFCSRKPAQEQAVAHGLLVVGTVAQIEHDVGIGAEELHDDAYHRLAYLRIAGRGHTAAVHQVEPVGRYWVEERFRLKTHSIDNGFTG